MDHLSIDTVPLSVLPGIGGTTYIVRIDETAGHVHLDPAPSQARDM